MEFVLIYLMIGLVFGAIISLVVSQSLFYRPTFMLVFVVTLLWPLYLLMLLWNWMKR